MAILDINSFDQHLTLFITYSDPSSSSKSYWNFKTIWHYKNYIMLQRTFTTEFLHCNFVKELSSLLRWNGKSASDFAMENYVAKHNGSNFVAKLLFIINLQPNCDGDKCLCDINVKHFFLMLNIIFFGFLH